MSEKTFTVSVSDDGTARVTFTTGTYGRVGYRSSYVYLTEKRVAGHGKAYVPGYEASELDRTVAALGKDGEKLLLDILRRVAVGVMAPSEDEKEKDSRYAQEATEAEEREKAEVSGAF